MMMHGRRPVGLCQRFSLIASAVLSLFILSASVVAALDTEVVSPRMVTRAAPGGGSTAVPDLAVSGQIIVQLAPGATVADLQARLQANGGSILRVIRNTPLVVISLPDGMPVTQGQKMWAAEAVTALAEPDRLMYPTVVPDDPDYFQQYHWDRIAAPAGWDIQTGGPSTVIAILGSGYDPDHEDLAGKYWVNQAELAGTEGVDDDGNGYIDDFYGWDTIDGDNDPDAGPPAGATPGLDYEAGGVSHGTHCAGIVGAITNNGVGVAGHDWGARLMMVRVLGFEGGTNSACIEGIQYAIDNGANVISMSLGGEYTPTFDAVIANARDADVLVVAAAGNEAKVFSSVQDDTWVSPVCNDGPNLGVDNFVLGVAASDSGDVAADFSNRDGSGYNFVDVTAPGVQIYSTLYFDPTFPDLAAPYGAMSGTSMACPVVAGLGGLVRRQYPGMSAANVIRQIRDTCDDISDSNPLTADTLGSGRINTAAALGVDVPPDPVSALQARDTVGDEGGSITVSWGLPRQDGDDVVGYNLLRAPESNAIPNTPGSFSQLANLPPGTSSYIDAPVPDDTPYWYQVVTLDASNAVPSAVAGPARARDDLAPPPVENLVAVDTQADEGGSISLSWFGYDFPDDLAEYRVYRATTTFSDVAEMEPVARVLPADGQHYVDRTTEDGTQYWYAVTAADDTVDDVTPEGNEDTEVTAVGPVVSNPNYSFNYPPGLSLISAAAMPATPASDLVADMLGLDGASGENLAYWDPALNGGEYIIWSDSPTSPMFRAALGRSWWLRTSRPLMVNVSGEAAPDGDFQKQLVAGWNQVGNPFIQKWDFGATEVTGIGQGTPVSLQTSNELGYTRDYAWAYDAFANSYRLVTAANLPFATDMVDKGRGVLMFTRRPATLQLKRQMLPTSAQTAQAPEFDGWALRLTAEAQDVADTDNFLGVCSNADSLSGMISPPRPDADLDLYFVRSASEGSRLATDFVAPEAAGEWQIKVACGIPGATVRLSWPDMSGLPAECRPTLVDNQTGRRIYLRTNTGYSYEVGDEPGERSFTVVISDTATGALAISTLSAGATAGRAQIVYSLSQDASVDIEVLNIAGVTVRRVVSERAQAAGPQQVTWDGRNASGSAAPAGTYIIRVIARSDDGQQVSAIGTLRLGR